MYSAQAATATIRCDSVPWLVRACTGTETPQHCDCCIAPLSVLRWASTAELLGTCQPGAAPRASQRPQPGAVDLTRVWR